jgi:hypothetical protein
VHRRQRMTIAFNGAWSEAAAVLCFGCRAGASTGSTSPGTRVQLRSVRVGSVAGSAEDADLVDAAVGAHVDDDGSLSPQDDASIDVDEEFRGKLGR